MNGKHHFALPPVTYLRILYTWTRYKILNTEVGLYAQKYVYICWTLQVNMINICIYRII